MATRSKKRKRKRVDSTRRQKEHKSDFGSTCYTLPEGMGRFKLKREEIKRVDIIPFEAKKGNPYADPGDLHYERTFFIHRGIGPNDNSYVCPAKTLDRHGKKGRCPICEERARMTKDPDADEKLIKDLAPKERQLWLVYDHSNREEGVQLWDVSYHLFGRQLDREIKNADEDEDFGAFADPIDGSTLKLGVEEKSIPGSTNTFYCVETVGFKPRKSELDEDIYEDVASPDDMLSILGYDELKAIFLEVDDSDGDEEGEEAPPKKKKKPAAASEKKKKKPAPVEEDDWDEEDEEEEAPPKKKKKKPAPVEEDDDDDDDWD